MTSQGTQIAPDAGPAHFRIASLSQRLVAAAIDLVVLGAAFVALAAWPLWLGATLFLAVGFANTIVAMALWGLSLGKALVGIRVVKEVDGSVPRFGTAFIRAGVQSFQVGFAVHPFGIEWLTVIVGPWPLVCYGPLLADRELRRGLHDRIAGTLVIRDRTGA